MQWAQLWKNVYKSSLLAPGHRGTVQLYLVTWQEVGLSLVPLTGNSSGMTTGPETQLSSHSAKDSNSPCPEL